MDRLVLKTMANRSRASAYYFSNASETTHST